VIAIPTHASIRFSSTTSSSSKREAVTKNTNQCITASHCYPQCHVEIIMENPTGFWFCK
jgi:NAD-dependent dihydropyrimidine dehydrogenase PreA subunit